MNILFPSQIFSIQSYYPDFALLFLRLFIGVCFIIHALGKLGFVGPGNMTGFTAWLKSLGVPAPAIQARLAMASEFIGGIFIALGFATRIGCTLTFATMVVASLIGHRGGGYLITNQPPGNEYSMNLAVISVVIFLLGPGQFSIDSFLQLTGV